MRNLTTSVNKVIKRWISFNPNAKLPFQIGATQTALQTIDTKESNMKGTITQKDLNFTLNEKQVNQLEQNKINKNNSNKSEKQIQRN